MDPQCLICRQLSGNTELSKASSKGIAKLIETAERRGDQVSFTQRVILVYEIGRASCRERV